MALYEKSEGSGTLAGFRKWIGESFSKIGLSPNQWTIISLVIAALAFIFIVYSQFVLGAILIAVSGFIDLIDGAVARHTKTVSKEGAYIDTVVDRYSELLYILPLAFLVTIPSVFISFRVWLVLYIFGAMMTTYVKAAAKEKELGVGEIRGGVVERAERVTIYVVGLLLGAINLIYLAYVVALLAILVNISALQRIKKTLDSMNNPISKVEIKPKEEEVVAAVKFEKKGKFDNRTVGEENKEEEPKRIVPPTHVVKKEEKKKGDVLKI